VSFTDGRNIRRGPTNDKWPLPTFGQVGCFRLVDCMNKNEQAAIWELYKPRHTHSWNMLVLSYNHLASAESDPSLGFEIEYLWENFILRLWLYRMTVKSLTHIPHIADDAANAIERFDLAFRENGHNTLKALRDMIEHWDDYAAGKGRGPAERWRDLDPWRSISVSRFARGKLHLELSKSYEAAIALRADATCACRKFSDWYKSA